MASTGRGFRPHMVAALLDESLETLKYWRRHVLPGPSRALYTGRELIALRIIKAIRRDSLFTPNRLKRYPLQTLFDFCRSQPLARLRTHYLVLDEATQTLSFHPSDAPPTLLKRGVFYVDLGPILAEHDLAVANLGE